VLYFLFFFSSRRRHTRFSRDWSSDVCSSDLDSGLNEVVAANLDKVDARDGAILLRILDHIHAVDRIFQHHLLELPHSFAAPRSEAAPAFRELARGMKELDDWYVSYVDALPEDDF